MSLPWETCAARDPVAGNPISPISIEHPLNAVVVVECDEPPSAPGESPPTAADGLRTMAVTVRLYRVGMRPDRVLERILRGDVGNVGFDDLVRLIRALGFREVGGRGSHRVFARDGVSQLINLQAEKGQAKRYQVRQVAALVRQYHLRLEDH